MVLASHAITVPLYCIQIKLMLMFSGCVLQEDKLIALIKAAGVTIEPFWPGLFAKVGYFPAIATLRSFMMVMETVACGCVYHYVEVKFKYRRS